MVGISPGDPMRLADRATASIGGDLMKLTENNLSEWDLIAATELDIHAWSYGQVRDVKDLYEPAVFGAAKDLECACGTLKGAATVGQICTACGVRVQIDSATHRRRRMGRIELACHWTNPMSARPLREIPIAPVGFRLTDDGQVNDLGKRYEKLVRLNAQLLSQVDWEDKEAYCLSGYYSEGHTELNRVITEIVFGTSSAIAPAAEPSSLMALIHHAIINGTGNLDVLTRSCGLVLRVKARI